MTRHASPEGQATMRFIVHADDCGLTSQISEDIFDCLAHGPLNSVSVIMGGTHTAASLQRLAEACAKDQSGACPILFAFDD